MADPTESWLDAARKAGLDRAVAEYRDDVAAAAATAAAAAAGLTPPSDVRAEPWPPMRIAPAP